MFRYKHILTVVCLSLFLAACDSAEERAEGHFQNAINLLQEGDPDRAIVELRNVFQLVPNHLEARHLIARTFLVEKENVQAAYGQYLRLVEQYPEDAEARIVLAELAFTLANWDEMDRHGAVARELAPDDERVQAIAAAMEYRAAIEAEDDSARREIARSAIAQIDEANPNRLLRELVLDDMLRGQQFNDALSLLDELTTEFPDEQRFWSQRLQVLLALGDEDAVERQLIDLVQRFPDDSDQKQILVRYYLSRGELDKTEAFLRQLVAEAPEDDIGSRIDLIRFLTELRGPEAAMAEIAAARETAPDPSIYIMLGTSIDYTNGNREQAINELESAIEAAEPSSETSAMQVRLAEMLLGVGNEVGARALVEEVLQEDAANPSALKMSAAWMIEADDTDGAIASLRTALEANPNDAGALSLMASAYSRAGSVDLARDFLGLAVEASGNAPAETLRYAQLLISEERFLSVEDILLPALRIAPSNLDLLRMAGQLYLLMEDSGRTQQVIQTLRRLETDEANLLATQLEAEVLNQTSGAEGALQFLENLAGSTDSDVSSRVLLLRARMSAGDVAGALDLAEGIASAYPDSPTASLVLATTYSFAGQYDRALEIYDTLRQQFPEDTGLVTEIATLYSRNGAPEAAREVIDAALEQAPEDPRLLWASASYKEVDGDVSGAIEIYERMYEQDSNSIIVANNLASLLATYRADDEASIERAWTIARRFRTSEIAAVQDTYGWLTHLRGNSEDALPYLQSAAANLPSDPIVQFHLAEVLFALGQSEAALDQYRTVLERAGVGDTRPQISAARDRIAELESAPPTVEN